MLKIIAIIAVLLAIAAAGIVAYAATMPDTFRIERSASMKASPDKIFATISDFKNWPSWSPWQKLDPNMTQSLSGAPTGKGAVSEWQGNSNVGAGRTEITDVTPPARIVMKLDMSRPMEAHNIVEYMIVPKGGETNVTWAMHGSQPFMAKIFSVFVDCDKMVGSAFEEGLASLKAIVEKS